MEKLFQQSMFAIGCRCVPVMEFITDNDTLEPMEVGGGFNDNIELFETRNDAEIRMIELIEDTDDYDSDMLDIYCINVTYEATPYFLT